MRRFITLGKRRWRRGIKTAVTLIDVAATVVALTLLALWLVPAVASVAGSSKGSKCLSNLMQIGYANAVYAAQDPTDMAIPVHPMQYNQCPGQKQGELCTDPIYVGAYEWGGKSGIGRNDFVTGSPGDPLNSKYGTLVGFGPASRPLNNILYATEFADAWASGHFDRAQAQRDTQLDLDVYQCPSDTGYTGIHCPSFAEKGLTSYDHFGTSYNANLFMTAMGGGEMMSNSPYLHRMSDLTSPARTLAYQENNGRFAWAAAPDPCFFIPGVPGAVRGWHGKDWTFNAAFLDGHADTIYMRGYNNPDIGRYPPGASYAVFQCIIIRGEGWQIDTLPVPPVPTGLWQTRSGRPSYEDCISSE
jgi:hypothetical protein